MIKLTNINKYYNKGRSNQIHVLNDISLELPDTSLVTILGVSGSGKSTLLNVIGGLDKASGTINYNDELIVDKYNPSKIDDYRNNKIGYIFQNYHLINELSVYDNLAYALDLIGIVDKEDVNNRIDHALNLVNMKKYKRRNAIALSGGQRQRVAIARAIAKGANILIADEPTGNLDENNTIEVMNILKTMSKSYLVLLITHDKEIASKYSDRIINLVDGKIISDEVIENNNKLHVVSGKLYLDQLNNQNLTSENNNVKIYSDNSSNIDLKVYIKDNVVYLDIDDKNTKVIGMNSDLKVEENTPKNEEAKAVDISMFNKDDVIYKNNYFKYFLNKLYYSFKTFFNRSKKMKFLSVLFFLFGFYIYGAIATLGLLTIPGLDTANSYSESIRIDSALSRNLEEKLISDEYSDTFIAPGNLGYTEIQVPLLFNQLINYNSYSVASNYHFDNIGALEDDEVILTKYLADDIFDSISKYQRITRNDLINRELIINGKTFTIVGINENLETNVAITNYDNFYNINYQTKFYNSEYNYYLKSDLEKKGYTFPAFSTSNSSAKAFYTINESIQNLDTNYYECDIYNAVIFLTEEDYTKYMSDVFIGIIPFYHPELVLSEGVLPRGEDQVVLPSIYKDSLMVEEFEHFEITGYYDLEEGAYPYIYQDNITTLFANRVYNSYIFTNDSKLIIDNFKSEGYTMMFEKVYIEKTMSITMIAANASAIGQLLFFLGVLVLIIFFMSRAKMISKIRTIGIYRAIGSSKKRIYIAFITDALVLTTMTTAISFTLAHISRKLLVGTTDFLATLDVSHLRYSVCLILIYVVVLVSSVLPIFTLLRKTPIEINAKYDI
ncbi:MAG: ABC transporter ATP-binding protein [bacterium]